MRGVCAAVLTFESIVILLAIPVAITVSNVDAGVAIGVGVGLAVMCLLVAGLLGRPGGYRLGWVVQLATVALGFVVPVMFLLGGLFALFWFFAIKLGRDVERIKAERAEQAADAQMDAGQVDAGQVEDAQAAAVPEDPSPA